MSALIGRSIDSVIDQMDVDHIISRIDIDRVVSRIDINKILDSVDLDRQIARVDINAILERTDINAVLERSNLEEIVARSSTGIFSQLVDFIRIYIVKLDLLLYRAGKCSCLKQEVYLPPRPGRKGRGSTTTEKQSLVAHIVQVQDAWSGVVSRGVSWLIDEIVAIVTFGAATLILKAVADMIKDDREYTIDPIIALFMYVGWDVHLKIVCLILSRRTVGMSVVGLKLVNLKGHRPNWFLIILRQYIQPIFSKLPGMNMLAALWAICRSDGRFPFDVLTCTGCVYRWNVSLAKMRLSSLEKTNRKKKEDDDDDEYSSSASFDDLFP